jgi:hypothetical protein
MSIGQMCHICILSHLIYSATSRSSPYLRSSPTRFGGMWCLLKTHYSCASRNGSTPPLPPVHTTRSHSPTYTLRSQVVQGAFHTPVAEATCSMSSTPSLPSASHSTFSPAPDSGFLAEDAPPPTQNANVTCYIFNDEMICHLASPSGSSVSWTRTVICNCAHWSSLRRKGTSGSASRMNSGRPSRTLRVPSS